MFINVPFPSAITKNNILCYFLLTTLLTFAQEEIAPSSNKESKQRFSYAGTVDVYYRYGIDTPNHQVEEGYSTPGTAFANSNGFSLGMFNLNLEYVYKNKGVVADLVIGPRGQQAVFLSENGSQLINQLYVYWNFDNRIKLTLGNFNTFLGYEIISPQDNFNYSTSYMFSYGPFSHTGLKADFAINTSWSAMLAVMNPTDYTEKNPFDTYILGAQLGYTTNQYTSYLNLRYGNEDNSRLVEPTFQIDWTTGWDLTQRFYIGLNTTYLNRGSDASNTSSGFYGLALYSQYKTDDRFTIGIRGEYFSQYNFDLVTFDEFTGAPLSAPIAFDSEGNGDVVAITLTGNCTVGNLALKPEIRIDYSEGAFIDSKMEPSSSISSFLLAAVYKF